MVTLSIGKLLCERDADELGDERCHHPVCGTGCGLATHRTLLVVRHDGHFTQPAATSTPR
jgi:hypothetical protein